VDFIAHRKVPNPAIPIPALDVPYAAPTVENTIYMSAPDHAMEEFLDEQHR
jgi:hypothetical protein